MKTVTIKLRIHKLLAEKRLTKYRFYRHDRLGYKNASRILDNETESIRFSTIARICSALDCTPGDLFEVHEEEDPYDGMLLNIRKQVISCADRTPKKELSTDGLHRLL